MDKQLQAKLYARYPQTFREKDQSIEESCMHWGLAVDDGWYGLLDIACSLIQNSDVIAKQVKEKFGTLRFYTSGGGSFENGVIWAAEALSGAICEKCGAPGYLVRDAWVRTLCEAHGGTPDRYSTLSIYEITLEAIDGGENFDSRLVYNAHVLDELSDSHQGIKHILRCLQVTIFGLRKQYPIPYITGLEESEGIYKIRHRIEDAQDDVEKAAFVEGIIAMHEAMIARLTQVDQ